MARQRGQKPRPLPGEPAGVELGTEMAGLAAERLHLPGKPARVELGTEMAGLAAERLHLPGKPAGVGAGRRQRL